MPSSIDPWVRLNSGELSAEIEPRGAQLSTLKDRGARDLLWNGDPSIWAGRAPLLFPIVGALAGSSYRLGSQRYPLSRHGFARSSDFRVVDASRSAALFRLTADAASLRVYPFRFELDVHYALNGATLSLVSQVRNLGDADMPASFGYHPAFRWPLPYGEARAAHAIEFADDEPSPVRRLDANGLLSPERHPSPIIERRLALEDRLFDEDALIFDELRSRFVSYGAPHGPRIRVDFADAPYLGLWTKPGAPFICIEPWHGIADPKGYAGDFRAKPGVFTVAPGESKAIQMAIALLA